MADANFDKEVVKVFQSPEHGKRGNELAIVRWIKDGRAFDPQLVNQAVYYEPIPGSMDVIKKYGKAKGLKLADVALILKNKDEILALLKGAAPAPVKAKTDAKLAAAGDVPWEQ